VTPVARWIRRAGIGVVAGLVGLALAAPVVAPNPPGRLFADRSYAPPMRPHIHDAAGFHLPFVYRQVLANRLLREFREDTSQPEPLRWFSNGRLVSIDDRAGPLLWLGADALGRDVFSRLLYGAQLSLGVAFLGVAGALAVGALVGGLAGGVGGWLDTVLMLAADFVLVLPGAYLVLVLRGVLPQVLTPAAVFWLMAGLFVVAGWPHVARGVRAIVATERARDYADAARASGAGPLRLVVSHLLPAARGFLAVEIVLLVPALLVAEVTVSYLGLGFPEPTASWGTMLQDAANVSIMSRAPWILAPAAALFLVVFGLQLAGGSRTESALVAGGRR
jgi:peptide/nickel transport system permease protein